MISRDRDQSNKERPHTPPSDRLLDSPPKLIILCLAVLVISVSGGILIGNIMPKMNTKLDFASVSALVLPKGPSTVTAGFEPSPFENNDYPWESPFTANAYPPEPIESEHIASLNPTNSAPEISNGKTLGSRQGTLVEESASFKGEPPWKKYAALSPPLDGQPLIALIIDDVGLSQSRVEELAELPALLTLAFLPYASHLQQKTEIARERGHEIMLHLPMEPTDQNTDPGPDALLVGLSKDEIHRRTIKNLDSFTGYVGVNNHMGSRFTADKEKMAVVMNIMAARGLLFLDSKTTSASKGYRLAVERGMPSAKRDIFIDNVISEEAILKQLAKVENISSRKGVVIAIGHPHKETLSALRKWLPEAKKRGFLFVPMTAVTNLTFNG